MSGQWYTEFLSLKNTKMDNNVTILCMQSAKWMLNCEIFRKMFFTNLFERATGEWRMLILYQSPISPKNSNQDQLPSKIPRKSWLLYSLQGSAVSVPIFKNTIKTGTNFWQFAPFLFWNRQFYSSPFIHLSHTNRQHVRRYCEQRITLTLLSYEIAWTQHNNTTTQ